MADRWPECGRQTGIATFPWLSIRTPGFEVRRAGLPIGGNRRWTDRRTVDDALAVAPAPGPQPRLRPWAATAAIAASISAGSPR
jgi:hypothetical protein